MNNIDKDYRLFLNNSKSPLYSKFNNFTKFVKRQTLARFIAIYEIFKMQKNMKGSVIDCGVNEGMSLMSLAQLSTILEPYNYHRNIFGFDTFEGFPKVSKKDKNNKISRKGFFKHKYNSYQEIIKSINFYNNNRFLNKKNKIQLIKGDATKTIPVFLKKNKHLIISSLWLDFDIYEPTKVALEYFSNHLVNGSIIVFDELNNPMWPGETQAFLEFKKIKYKKISCFDFEPNLSYIVITKT
jgi:hypothetical protein